MQFFHFESIAKIFVLVERKSEGEKHIVIWAADKVINQIACWACLCKMCDCAWDRRCVRKSIHLRAWFDCSVQLHKLTPFDIDFAMSMIWTIVIRIGKSRFPDNMYKWSGFIESFSRYFLVLIFCFTTSEKKTHTQTNI